MGKLWFGTIYTMEREGQKAEAIYSEGDRIIRVGDKAALEEEFAHLIDEKIDLEDNVLFPGFIDSHLHLIGHGEKLNRLDLSGLRSKEAVLEKVKSHLENVQRGEWLIGEGWNENVWETDAVIHRSEIDFVSPDNPVILKRVCRHALIANSAALKRAGVNENTECPPGGVIACDNNGALNGLLKDKAMDLVLSAVPQVTDAYLERAVSSSIQDLQRLGLTGGHTEDLNYYGGYRRTINAFKKVIEQEGVRFRAHLLVHHEAVDEMVQDGGKYLGGNEWIELGAMKIFADGSLGGRTALLSHPYNDCPETSGIAIYTQEELNGLVKKARDISMPVAVHAIGDQAFDMILTAIENHPLKGNGRDRLIHAQILRKDLIERVKRLPVVLDIQPVFLASDYPWVLDRIGKENMEYCYAWRTLLEEGLPCAGGSDAPIEVPDPLFGIHAAVTRTAKEDPAGRVYQPEQCLSVFEAVSLYTSGSAYAACHENDRGIIKEGYLADFTIFDSDLFKIKDSEITNASVQMTIIGGEIVFNRKKTGEGI